MSITHDNFVEPFDHQTGAKELQQASLALDHHQTEDLVPYLSHVRQHYDEANMIAISDHTRSCCLTKHYHIHDSLFYLIAVIIQ
ncbi:hypothetical protein [Bacillus changyiensis]|uniref:hypothetical protein n=1 Tax=Bacillus changyiensis TaxID=3004103 RepID=UPI0022E7957D|nr:hypothetical protein [Bacillus changyiensis]MDA1477641.1 hypothetical protein [Bacillus changyiensis]